MGMLGETGARMRDRFRCLRTVLATRAEAGMTTAEYAVGTLAACGFAALLYKVVTSGSVAGALEALITKALDAKF